MDATALIVAILGGVFWAFGLVGKRYVMEGAPDEVMIIWSAAICIPYILSGCAGPAVQILLYRKDCMAVMVDEEWRARLLGILCSGVLVGAGTLLALYTLTLAKENGSSAVAALVMNGVFTAATPLVLTFLFGEDTSMTQWFGIVCVCLGVLLLGPGVHDLFHCFSSHKKVIHAMEQPLVEVDISSSTSEGAVMASSVLVGILWLGCPVGYAYGSTNLATKGSLAESALTAFLSMFGSSFPAVAMLLGASATKRAAVLGDAVWRSRLPGAILSGTVNGGGALLCVCALALSGGTDNALMTTIENGVYIVGGTLLIAMIYREKLSALQVCGSIVVVFGILLLGLPG